MLTGSSSCVEWCVVSCRYDLQLLAKVAVGLYVWLVFNVLLNIPLPHMRLDAAHLGVFVCCRNATRHNAT